MRKKCLYSDLFWFAFFPHFPAFGLNTERKCRKNVDQNKSDDGHLLRSEPQLPNKSSNYEITGNYSILNRKLRNWPREIQLYN